MRTTIQGPFYLGQYIPGKVRLSTEQKKKVYHFEHPLRRKKEEKGRMCGVFGLFWGPCVCCAHGVQPHNSHDRPMRQHSQLNIYSQKNEAHGGYVSCPRQSTLRTSARLLLSHHPTVPWNRRLHILLTKHILQWETMTINASFGCTI